MGKIVAHTKWPESAETGPFFPFSATPDVCRQQIRVRISPPQGKSAETRSTVADSVMNGKSRNLIPWRSIT